MGSLAAIPFDTIAFIVLVIIASFFRWISKEAEKAKRKTEQPPTATSARPIAQPRRDNDEERVRRFLEALGQSGSSQPPPPIKTRSITSKEKPVVARRKVFSPLPPLTTVPPPLPVEAELPRIPPPALEPAVSRTGVPLTVPREKMAALAPTEFPETVRESSRFAEIATMLSSGRGLRDAVILREIFGPPRSLQTLEH